MRTMTVAAIQMQCGKRREDNIAKAEHMVRKASEKGAQVVLLPELFQTQYFCQEKSYKNYDLARSVNGDPAVEVLSKLARELRIVLPVSFYEQSENVLYNSVAVIDADGQILGVYRKTHIPDDQFYQEKFYFTPGDSGFQVWDTRYGKIGIGICWDQWFPETARCLALAGAEVIFYPTAIGSEPILECDSMPHWRRCMQGHSAANLVPVVAANRIGTEDITPTAENNQQSSSLTFYGSSFITDETGEVLQSAGRDREEILVQTIDLDRCRDNRLSWGIFRDRRPECYGRISAPQ